jgi:hypothetical protein
MVTMNPEMTSLKKKKSMQKNSTRRPTFNGELDKVDFVELLVPDYERALPEQSTNARVVGSHSPLCRERHFLGIPLQNAGHKRDITSNKQSRKDD